MTQPQTEVKPNRNVYSLESLAKLPKCHMIQVRQMSESKAIQFVSDSQDTQFFKEYFNCKFDSFFVVLNDAGNDYTQVWGMVGTVPYAKNSVTKIL